MPLQTRKLTMVGLGTLGDAPPNPVQPPLADGIHLRWAFERGLGFPWYGFYLFRRPSQEIPVGRMPCLSRALDDTLPVGPWPFNYLETPLGRVSSDRPLLLRSEPDSTSKVGFDLSDRGYLRFDFQEPVRAVRVAYRFSGEVPIKLTVLSGTIPVAEFPILGGSSLDWSPLVEFDAISAVELGPGPAVLVDVCFWPVARGAMDGWRQVPNFPYPMCLPVTRPDYPCTLGMNEDLSRARDLARGRILYGDPDKFTRAPEPIYASGTVHVVNGSSVVAGAGTDWGQDLAGEVLQVGGEATAYGIATVVAPSKLVLNRSYGGATGTGRAYAINRDDFGQLHDHLLHLVSGGDASGPMAARSVPDPAYTEGTISVAEGSRTVTGDNTSWDTPLEGLMLQVIADSGGTVAANHGSPVVRGNGTSWGADLAGLALEFAGEGEAYSVRSVESPTRLTLDRGYAGSTGDRKPYRIVEEAAYTIARVDSPTQLELDQEYSGTTSSGLSYAISAGFRSEESGDMVSSMPRQYPLDLILLASLHPAVAQMVGLYWIDQQVNPNRAYDYLIVANRVAPQITDPNEMLGVLRKNGFQDLDGYIVFNKRTDNLPKLMPPEDLRVYALPDGSERSRGGALSSVGLRWDLGVNKQGWLLPYKAVMYHLWRAALGNTEVPGAPTGYPLATKEDRPVLVAEPLGPPETPQRAADWPPFAMHAVDAGLPEGWYGYLVSGIDVFGRHSAPSAAGHWHQWIPPPEPRPWYYRDPPADAVVHPSAVRLLDKVAPPPPTGIEAYALDPADPTVLRDAAYAAWRDSLTSSAWYQALSDEEKENLIGLRVRWLWTPAHMRQAPDTREFRVYYHPGQLNESLGHTLGVSTVSATESDVETDIPNTQPANAYAGASLRIGSDAFEVVGNGAGSPLRLRVKSGPIHTAGTISVENRSPTVTGKDTSWDGNLTGSTLRVAGERPAYIVLGVDPSAQQLRLDRGYEGPTGAEKAYSIAGKLPRANAPCILIVPPDYTAGTISVESDSPVVTGTGTGWSTKLAGRILRVAGESSEYAIVRVDSDTQLMLDRAYVGPYGSAKAYAIRHQRFADYSLATEWAERWYVVGYDEHVQERMPAASDPNGELLLGQGATVSGSVVFLDGDPDLSGVGPGAEHLFLENDMARPRKIYHLVAADNAAKTVTVDGAPDVGAGPSPWVIGPPQPLRQYEVFVPASADALRAGLPLAPSSGDPIVYAHVGVSAADDKTHTPDARTSGAWGNRFGNEGRVGLPAKIFRVHRKPPDQPQVPPADSDAVYATPADYHSRSFYTYRWQPAKPANHLKTHVFRALDDAVFKVDWLIRSTRIALDPANVQHEAIFPTTWPPDRKQAAANQLNAITSLAGYAALSNDAQLVLARLPGNEVFAGTSRLQQRDWAIRTSRRSLITSFDAYHSLSNDGMRVLAGLPGNERAFTQLTIQPLDPQEPDPDDPSRLRWRDRVGPDTDTSYIPQPTLRAYVDALDGRSTNRYFYRSAYVDGAHNRGSLSLSSPPVWLRNVVPPRTPVITKVLGGDRQITLRWASNREPDLAEYRVYRADSEEAARDLRLMTLVQEIVPIEDPVARPAEVTCIDTPVPGLLTFYYTVVAVDGADNMSVPSPTIAGRAFDDSRPAPPKWNHPVPGSTPDAIVLSWVSPIADLACLVQRRSAGAEDWGNISGWLARGTYTFADTLRIPGMAYNYRLRVLDTRGRQNGTFNVLTS